MKKYVIFNSCDVLIKEYETEEEATKELEKLENTNDFESYRIEERKIYKIYAQCCRAVHPIQEVDERTALSDTWTDAESYFYANNICDFKEGKEEEGWEKVADLLDVKIREQWEKSHILECGDYIFWFGAYSEIHRPNAGGHLDESIFNEVYKEIDPLLQ